MTERRRERQKLLKSLLRFKPVFFLSYLLRVAQYNFELASKRQTLMLKLTPDI